ncbi:MAG: hypothetical protein ABDH37_00835 [Candidatus Hydrothermales bacterium]
MELRLFIFWFSYDELGYHVIMNEFTCVYYFDEFYVLSKFKECDYGKKYRSKGINKFQVFNKKGGKNY